MSTDILNEQYTLRAARLKKLGIKTYADYLASDEWARVKEYVFKTRENICEICLNQKRLILHHTTYRNIHHKKVSKSSQGIKIICWDCHSDVHQLSKKKNISLKSSVKSLKKRRKKELEDIAPKPPIVMRGRIMLMELTCKDCGESLNYIVDTNDENTIKDMTQIDITQHIISHYNKHNNEYNNL